MTGRARRQQAAKARFSNTLQELVALRKRFPGIHKEVVKLLLFDFGVAGARERLKALTKIQKAFERCRSTFPEANHELHWRRPA